MVRIAFATNKGGLDDQIADRFGRAPTYTIVDVDLDTGEIKSIHVIENPGYQAGGGAGVTAVQRLIEEKVEVAVGPSPGPNAYTALQQAGIKIISITGVTVREALRQVLEELKSS